MAVAQQLKTSLQILMQEKGLWQDYLEVEVPKRWERYGDMILFDKARYLKSDAWCVAGADVWTCICKIMKVGRIAFKGHITSDGFRSPNVELVWGKSPWVQHKDNGILYTWDITRSMFCAGNASERHRIGKFDCQGEVVVDLYAGIGYFTLPYLVHANASMVHACEWNPAAVEALRKNLELNKVSDRCIVHQGDNRLLNLDNIADRVNLGLLPSSQDGWKLACRFLKLSGGMLYVHENVNEGEEEEWKERVCSSILNLLRQEKGIDKQWNVVVQKLNSVKSYAPHIHHLVLDLACKPCVSP